MKNIICFILISLPFFGLSQEKTVFVGDEEYKVLKEEGNLDGYHIKYLLGTHEGEIQGIPTSGVLPTPAGGGGGTGDPCNPWIQPNDFEDPNYPLGEGETYNEIANNGDDAVNGPFSLGWDFCFYGETYSQVFINNNGNLSFGTSYGTFTPAGFPSTQYVMIAPFWGDVNMAAEGGNCYYAITETAMYVNWVEVGYYGSNDNLKNSFQVIITDGSDPIVPGGNNVSFAYLDMNWTTGTASQGTAGFGGAPAQVGANSGDGNTFILFGEFNVDSDFYDGPYNENDGVHYLDYKYFVFNTCTESDNVAPIYEGGACTDLVVCQGGGINLDFLAPEENQSISVEYESESDEITITSFSNNDGTAVVVIGVSDDIAPGFYDITVIATDDFEADPGVTQIFYTLEVVEDDTPPLTISGPVGICPGEQANLIAENADLYDDLQWSTGATTESIFVTNLGLYSVTASTDVCLKYGSFELIEYPGATPVITAEDDFVCEGGTTTLTLGQDYPTIAWDFNANLNTQSVDLGEGTHIVNVTTEEGCNGTAQISLGVYPTTEIADASVCGNVLDVVGTVDLPGTWSSNGPGDITNNTNPNNTNTELTVSSCGEYTMVFTDDCNIQEEFNVLFLNDTGFSLEPQEFCFGDMATIEPIGCGKEQFNWEWSDNSTESILNFEANPSLVDETGFGTVSFEATNECGTFEGETVISILPCTIDIPNIFTPNGDGNMDDGYNNDYLLIEGLRNFSKAELQVFNRWGKSVYENNNYQVCYDDEFRNLCWSPTADEAPDGTYYYIIKVTKVTGDTETISGYMQILR